VSTTLPNAALIPPGVGGPPPVGATATRPSSPPATNGPSFASLLDGQSGPAAAPHFSRHALDRLAQRGIALDGQTVGRLTEGIGRAAVKGSRDSVVFVDRTAFVVSVRNNTVITAVDSGHMREQVFTNIDSAVIA
jgi:flagellar operon protein